MRSAIAIVLASFLFAATAAAQDFSFNSLFTFEPTRVSEGPQLNDVRPEFPEEARKHGIEGTVKVRFTLGRDGKVHDAVIVDDLPFGTGEAVKIAVEKMDFTPAKLNGTPVDVNATFSYSIAAFYDEYDKDVEKVKFTGKPVAEYPASQKADGRKGSVRVAATFYPDGKIKVIRSDSAMPNEFDEAAKKATTQLKFQPAVHKKSKKLVAQTLWIVFDFKP